MSVMYKAEDQPAKSREEYWQHLVSSSALPQDFRSGDGPDFRGQILAGEIGVFNILQATAPSGECHRTAKHIQNSDPDLLAMTFLSQGSMTLDHCGRQTRIGAGEFFLVDSAHPFGHTRSMTELIVVTFPLAVVPLLRRKELAELTGISYSGNRGLGALLSSLVQSLPRQMNDIGAVDGFRLSGVLLDLLDVAVADRFDKHDEIQPEARQRVLLHQILMFIEERLADPALSPTMIAAAHHISIRYLHKLFEEQHTTVAALIRRRRLECCRNDLLDPIQRGKPISAVAARWGFTSATHFNRVFRAAYTLTPGQYRTDHG